MDVLVEVVLPLVVPWIPEIKPLTQNELKNLTLNYKVLITAAILFIYLVMSQIPVYGAYGQSSDPFSQQRLILGSSKGKSCILSICCYCYVVVVVDDDEVVVDDDEVVVDDEDSSSK